MSQIETISDSLVFLVLSAVIQNIDAYIYMLALYQLKMTCSIFDADNV